MQNVTYFAPGATGFKWGRCPKPRHSQSLSFLPLWRSFSPSGSKRSLVRISLPLRYRSGSGVLRTLLDVRHLPRPPGKPAKFFLRRLSRRGGSGVWRGGGCGLRRVYRAGWSVAGKRWARLRRAVFLLRPYGLIRVGYIALSIRREAFHTLLIRRRYGII